MLSDKTMKCLPVKIIKRDPFFIYYGNYIKGNVLKSLYEIPLFTNYCKPYLLLSRNHLGTCSN